MISTSTADLCPELLRFATDGLRFVASMASRRAQNATTVAQGGYQHGGWDRYDLSTHVLHFSYQRAVGVIELVTLMVAG